MLNIDETGWRQSGEKRWIWAFVANSFTYYFVAASRGAEVLAAVLGSVFPGILCSDRYAGYGSYHRGKSQLCWAHLKRNLQAVLDQGTNWQQQRFARDALALYASLFRLWWKFQAGTIDRSQLIERSNAFAGGFENWPNSGGTVNIATSPISPPRSANTSIVSSASSTRSASSRPTTSWNGRCESPSSGARSVSATEATPARSPPLGFSLFRRHAPSKNEAPSTT